MALRIRRTFFDSILAAAVPSAWNADLFESEEAWSKAASHSSALLQWDPDHYPDGTKANRRAIQLGLRNKFLESFAQQELIEVINLSDFVTEQRSLLSSGKPSELVVPRERIYCPADLNVSVRLQLSPQV